MIRRLYLHANRYRGEVKFSVIFSVVFFAFYGGFFPKDGISDMVTVMQRIGVLRDISPDAAGWSIWLSIMVGTIAFAIVATTSINMGSRVVPTRDSDGAEYIMGSVPIDPRRYYTENVVSAFFALVVSMVPGYLVILTETFMFGSGKNLERITLAYSMFALIGLFFISVTSAVVAWRFERGLALGTGYAYIFLSMVIDVLGDNPDLNLSDLKKLSVNTYLQIPSIPLTEGVVDWNPPVVVLSVSAVFVAIGLLGVKRPQYVEKAMSKQGPSVVERTIGHFVRPSSSIARRFPLVAEQMRRDQKAVLTVLLIYAIYFPVLVSSTYGLGDDLSSVASSFNTPSTLMMTQGTELDSSLLSFAVHKVFMAGWLWFGLYGTLVAASIPTRDVRRHEQDLVYSPAVHPGKLVDRRVIAMLVEFTTLMLSAYVFFLISIYSYGEDFAQNYITWDLLGQYMVLTWVAYSAVFITITSVSMLPAKISRGRWWGLLFFWVSLLINWMAYASAGIEFVKYISIFEYYNPIQLLYGKMNFAETMARAALMLIGSLALYILAKRKYMRSSLY